MPASKVITNLIKNFQSKPEVDYSKGDKVKINTVISRAAFVYEKIRNAVDYNEEHLLRKNAIYRILKRKLLFEKVILENYLLEKYHTDNIAEQLVQELMRARYLNENITVSMVKAVDEVILKYNTLISRIKDIEGKVNKKVYHYLLEIEAMEIEQLLKPAYQEKAIIRAMFTVLNSRVNIVDAKLDEKEKELQLFLACHKALFKWDSGMQSYLLFSLYYPEWKNPTAELFTKLANNIAAVIAEFEKQKTHPWGKKLTTIVSKQAVIFWVIQDVMEENAANALDVFSQPEVLEEEVRKACDKRYKGVKTKLGRGVMRSIIYVFFTKMVLAVGLEFPFDIFLNGYVNYVTAATNILFPPLLMLFVALSIRMPKAENTKKIVDSILQISFNKDGAKKYTLKTPKHSGKFARFIFNFIYFLVFIFSLMVIFWFLSQFSFNVFSSLIFVMFLTLVSFFGIRIRRPVMDIMAIDKRDSTLGSLLDLVAMPYVSAGRWMSVSFSRINFFIFIFDFIIEAPFKLFISIFEDLFTFYREKKEDIMSE